MKERYTIEFIDSSVLFPNPIECEGSLDSIPIRSFWRRLWDRIFNRNKQVEVSFKIYDNQKVVEYFKSWMELVDKEGNDEKDERDNR